MAIEWTEKAREEARRNPEAYPAELRSGLEIALNYVLHQQADSFNQPSWDPVRGFLERALKELGEKGLEEV